MNIYCMLLSRKPKASGLQCRPPSIISTQSRLLEQDEILSGALTPSGVALAWRLQQDMVLEASQRRTVENGLFVANDHDGRGSFKSASFFPVLADNHRTPAGLAWTRPPTNHTASMRPLLWPLRLDIFPELQVAVILWEMVWDCQPHSLWMVAPYPLPLMSFMLCLWAVSFCSQPAH